MYKCEGFCFLCLIFLLIRFGTMDASMCQDNPEFHSIIKDLDIL